MKPSMYGHISYPQLLYSSFYCHLIFMFSITMINRRFLPSKKDSVYSMRLLKHKPTVI